jgi:hypothetical protein
MTTYSEHEQRMLDQQSGKELDKARPMYNAFAAGLKARRDGVHAIDNPHLTSRSLFEAWKAGWLTEDRHLQRNPHSGSKST